MKPKRLRDIAYALPEMFGGWRMFEDLERISDLPDGTIRVNLLNEAAEHSMVGPIQLHIAAEMSAWMKRRLGECGIPLDEISEAVLEAQIQTDKISTDKKKIVSFDFRIRSCITAGERKFERTLEDKHVWHRRAARS